MHLAISWDIEGSGELWKKINEQMLEVIKPYSWVKPLSTFYVVRVNGEPDRKSIQAKLATIADATTKKVHFIITPTMSAGRYDGFLPMDMWDKINERTS